MSPFVVAHADALVILRSGHCPAHAVALQAGPGEIVVAHEFAGEVSGDTHEVVLQDGAPVVVAK